MLHLIDSLSMDEESVTRLADLPMLHRDPFDRLLVCQAIQYGLTVATVDPIVQSYPINVL